MRFLVSEKLGPHKYKTPEGYLVCVDAILGRTGTQEYRRCELFGDACDNPDEIVFVDRKAEEVFSDKTMASFENKPICIEHPNSSVNAENHNELSVGFVRDVRRGEDNGIPVMMGTLVITDKEAVEAVERGEYKELSCGYDCDITDEPSPQQRNIRGNHVAICKQGRAGIARIVDSVVDDKDSLMNDAKLSAKQRNEISSYLSSISKYTKHDPDVIDLILPLERKGYKIFRKKIKGWYKTSEGTMRKDYFFGINGYDNTFMISVYADEGDWKVNEVNAYFIDSANTLVPEEAYKLKDSTNEATFTVEYVKDNHSGAKYLDEVLSLLDRNNVNWDTADTELAIIWFESNNECEKAEKMLRSKGFNFKSRFNARGKKIIELLDSVKDNHSGAKYSEDFQAGDIAQTQDTFTDEYVEDASGYFLVYSPKNKTYAVAEQDKHGSLSWEGFAKLIGTSKDDVKVSSSMRSTPEAARNTRFSLGITGYKEISIKDFIKDALTNDTSVYTVEYVKDGIMHIVEIEAASLEDAILKAKETVIKDGYNELQQQVKQLTEKLKIKPSLGISINKKTKRVMLFAYSVKQAERWVDKLKASGYKAELHRERGNVIVANFIMPELKTDSITEDAF